MKQKCKIKFSWISERTTVGLFGLSLIVIAFRFMMNLPNCKISGPKEWKEGTLRNFAIRTTWNGDCVKHEPIKISLEPSDNGDAILRVLGPFFNSPAKPDGPVRKPFPKLWNYEVVEAFFLSDKNNYLEIELSPHGQHLLLILKGKKNMVKDQLSLTTYKADIEGDRWSGEAIIPRSYFPPGVTKFNAYAIHGEGDDRIYEALYPAAKSHDVPDFHRLEYFQPINMNDVLKDYRPNEVSDLWRPYVNV